MQFHKSILVIDDDDAIRRLVARQLSTQYTVYEARDAMAAAVILAQIEPPNAIVCDRMMPGTSGTEFTHAIKSDAKYKHVRIIFLSALGSAADLVAGINAGARHYITKPFKMDDLMVKVERALAE